MRFSAPTPAFFARIPTGASGAYIIRTKDTGKARYIGESHTGRLRKTASRHFQRWNGAGRGKRYTRAGHEIAIIETAHAKARAKQDALIIELQPTDNEILPEGFEVEAPDYSKNDWDPF